MDYDTGRIADNVYSENSCGVKFPDYVYLFIKRMIQNSDHYFFIFN
jgi:hypothetical protein